MTSESLLRTPLYACHVAAGARLVPFAGYEMPVRYTSQVEEHQAVRTAAGLFDVSHMTEFTVRGAGAAEFVQWATPNDVSKLRVGRAHYSSLLDRDGRFLDDLLVYRRGEQELLLVANAAGHQGDWAHLEELESSWQGAAFELDDESTKWALLAVQGPKAPEIVAKACQSAGSDADVDQLRYYGFLETELLSQAAIVSRTGYTGEDGFEIYVRREAAADLWNLLLQAGGPVGLVPAGLGARDTLRLEAGMHLSGQDLGPDVTPLEVGLGWTVKLAAGDFVGREALVRQKEQGLSRCLVGFELTERGIARSGDVLECADAAARGMVTSGSWSPTLEKAIGLARVDAVPGTLAEGAEISVSVRKRQIAGRIAKLPFYQRPDRA